MIDFAAFIDWISILTPFFVLVGFVWAPKTWTPGELVTAASMNFNIRDHLNETLRVQVTTSTGTQNNFAVDGPFSYIKCNNASALSLTGALIDSGNVNGARVFVEAVNAPVTIKHQDSGSTSSNRFTNDRGADITLALNERAMLFYDTPSTTWRVGKVSTVGLAQTLGAVNFHPDPYVLIWPEGDDEAPAEATLTKDGNSALDRNTTTYLHGGMAPEVKLGNTATVSTVVKWVLFASLPVSWRGKTIGIGGSIYSATADLGKIVIEDGGTGGTTSSEFHDGGSDWDWISFTHEITSDATKLEFSIVADIGGQGGGIVSAIFDGLTITLGPSPPEDFKPTPSTEGILYFGKILGEVSTGTLVRDFDSRRPFLVTNVSLRAGVAPTGAALIVDVNHFDDGSVYQSMFSTRPQIAASALRGGADPDGTYRYRCFKGRKNAEIYADAWLTADIDQIGSTVPGSNLQIAVAVLQFQDPYAALK